MNNTMRRVIMDRRMRDRDYRRSGGRSDYGRGRMDYTDYDDDEPMYDGRQGVKGTGPYGIGGRRYSGGRSDRAGGDYGEYD